MIQRLFDIVEQRSKQAPDATMLAAKENGTWRTYSSKDVWNMSRSLAGGLLQLGIANQVLEPERQEKIAIVSPNRPEWMITDIGVQLTGAVLTPIYPTISPSEIAYVLNEAEVQIIFVANADIYERFKDAFKDVPTLKSVYSFDEVATYAGLDAEWTWKLWNKYSGKLDTDNLRGLFTLEMDVLEVICTMELRGADIDVNELEKLKGNLELQLETTKANIYKFAGKAFNINSVPEKQKILFSKKADGGRGLRPKVYTPAGEKRIESGSEPTVSDFSVAEPALKMFAGKDALVDEMLNYSDLNKLLTTYVIPYMGGDITRTLLGKSKTVAKKSLLLNGRIHTDFIQYGAETGRFSSRNPNLQNVPNPRTFNGKAIRNLFVAPEGSKLVVADYSQIEPRVLASFSGDRIMCTSYLEGVDIYTTIGNTVGVTRDAAKTLVLAMMYGVGPDKIADSIGVSVNEARNLLDAFMAKFPSVAKYKKQVINDSRKRGPVPYALTYLNRRRYIPDLRSNVMWQRSRAERQAFNTVIQGSSADLIKLAMIRAHKLIPAESSLILTIHDELVTVTPDHLAEETAAAIREAMEGIKALNIPMIADVKTVQRWGEAK